ncbi:hypothetical protein BEP19_05445 [Ammoniphilus oxalaticus]|uniref:LysM domain-containing protein n=1 Tax=Ammoniphilus oxalaticus TaxID=66863 RepID=A0A419SIN8_9BACL|nr:LysM peptidoglycan-binding domain-containing protein [Ammoniphilus oxalaticus]RKD23873.1 hypothetical protein BEP19_05445 [Ammoniphilus oxalaticus]
MMHKNGQGTYQIDLKEVLHLTDEQIPIEEIEDLELVQQIESKEYGDSIEITGSLIVYGNYRGNQDAGKLQPTDDLPDSFEESVLFEPLATDRGPFSPLAKNDRLNHQIPIQITLPRTKVKNVNEIYTYVSSFDYDIKTPYQIEVTASLIIGGLVDEEEPMENKPAPQEQYEFIYTAGQLTPDLKDSSLEPFQVFEEQASSKQDHQDQNRSHEQEESSGQIEVPERLKQPELKDSELPEPIAQSEFRESELESATSEPEERSQTNEPSEQVIQSIDSRESTESREPIQLNDEPEAEVEPTEQRLDREPDFEVESTQASQDSELPREEETEEVVDARDDEAEEREESTQNNVIPIPHLADHEAQERDETVQEEPAEQDVRIAITNKRQTEQQEEPISSISSFFANRAPVATEEAAPDVNESREKDEAAELDEKDRDATYLGNFMEDDAEQFTRVKICIIQKDETIDEIAERYELTVDAILRSNGTARNQVTAGQLLYIPVKG